MHRETAQLPVPTPGRSPSSRCAPGRSATGRAGSGGDLGGAGQPGSAWHWLERSPVVVVTWFAAPGDGVAEGSGRVPLGQLEVHGQGPAENDASEVGVPTGQDERIQREIRRFLTAHGITAGSVLAAQSTSDSQE